jgi:hypothetical protein
MWRRLKVLVTHLIWWLTQNPPITDPLTSNFLKTLTSAVSTIRPRRSKHRITTSAHIFPAEYWNHWPKNKRPNHSKAITLARERCSVPKTEYLASIYHHPVIKHRCNLHKTSNGSSFSGSKFACLVHKQPPRGIFKSSSL